MNWKDVTVLVTGINGFVGFRIAESLVDKGAEVVALIRDDIPGSPLEYSKIREKLKGIVTGDLNNYEILQRAFNEYEITICFHIAAQAIVGVANRSPLSTFESNIKGTWNILEASRNSKLMDKIVIASSDKAYGEHKQLPYTEDYCLNPLHTYDASKACADILARTYYNTYDMDISVARCANIYGGGDLNFSRIIPDTIQSVSEGKNPVIRSDGTPVRDYLYIKDAVGAYLKLGETNKKVKGKAFNFGSNNPISVIELVNKILKISGADLKPIIKGKGKTKGEIDRQYLSSNYARELLGWAPRYNIDEGLKETFKWYKSYFASL